MNRYAAYAVPAKLALDESALTDLVYGRAVIAADRQRSDQDLEVTTSKPPGPVGDRGLPAPLSAAGARATRDPVAFHMKPFLSSAFRSDQVRRCLPREAKSRLPPKARNRARAHFKTGPHGVVGWPRGGGQPLRCREGASGFPPPRSTVVHYSEERRLSRLDSPCVTQAAVRPDCSIAEVGSEAQFHVKPTPSLHITERSLGYRRR